MGHFIIKKPQTFTPSIKPLQVNNAKTVIEENAVIEKENKINKSIDNNMTTQEKIMAASSILSDAPKKIRKEKGLIERTESSKTILTEDNKELLRD